MVKGRFPQIKMSLLAGAVITTVIGSGCASVTDGYENPSTDMRSISASTLAYAGEVDERFQSYNVEMVEVTGGNFWAPYPREGEEPKYDVGPHGAGFATNQYLNRDPIDLSDSRLRFLTKLIGPAYVRVSGTWANGIFFDYDNSTGGEAPEGYQGVLTRDQWEGLVEFAKYVDAEILVSFATSEGARDSNGYWDPEGARRLFEFTHEIGGKISAVELTNEPNVKQKLYDPNVYAQDHVRLQSLLDEISPFTMLVGPGSTGEAGFKLFPNPPEEISTARLLSGQPLAQFDAFSYHFYGAVSQRCKSLADRPGMNGQQVTTSQEEAMSETWLSRASAAQRLYRGMRDRFAPGKPIWITETAQTACGGDPWASSFLDTFRYVDQLGRLAKADADVIFHNTLAASDYALIDERTSLPRPNYWAALLWKRLMGTVVLDAGANDASLHVYAHCSADTAGGVSIAVINLDKSRSRYIELSSDAERYTLTADDLNAGHADLNGVRLVGSSESIVQQLQGKQVGAGRSKIAPASLNFFRLSKAGNPSCNG